jgi:hypothetical protein
MQKADRVVNLTGIRITVVKNTTGEYYFEQTSVSYPPAEKPVRAVQLSVQPDTVIQTPEGDMPIYHKDVKHALVLAVRGLPAPEPVTVYIVPSEIAFLLSSSVDRTDLVTPTGLIEDGRVPNTNYYCGFRPVTCHRH